MVEKVAAKLSQTKGIISPFQILYGVRKKNMALPGSVGSWYSANSCGLECWWCWNFNIAILQIKWYGVGNSPTSPRRHATNLSHLFWFLSSGHLFSLKCPTETAAKSCKNRAIFGPQNQWENPNEHPPLVEVVHPRASRVTRSRRSPSSPKYCWWAAYFGWLISPWYRFDKEATFVWLLLRCFDIRNKDKTFKKSSSKSWRLGIRKTVMPFFSFLHDH